MSGNIFTDSNIVETIPIPDDIISNIRTKKRWGVQVLTDYLSRFYGQRRIYVSPSNCHENRLTGTQAVVDQGDKIITYMLVEPRGAHNKEVHVVKAESKKDEGSVMDVFCFNKREVSEWISPLAAAFQKVSQKK